MFQDLGGQPGGFAEGVDDGRSRRAEPSDQLGEESGEDAARAISSSAMVWAACGVGRTRSGFLVVAYAQCHERQHMVGESTSRGTACNSSSLHAGFVAGTGASGSV